MAPMRTGFDGAHGAGTMMQHECRGVLSSRQTWLASFRGTRNLKMAKHDHARAQQLARPSHAVSWAGSALQ
jgi:hypothetical protein